MRRGRRPILARRLLGVAAIAASLALDGAAWAHGDLHTQIAILTEKIAAAPNDPDLRIQRAIRYRLHEEFDRSIADLHDALRLGAAESDVRVQEGLSFLDSGRPEKARDAFRRAVALAPTDAKAHEGLAHARRALQDPLGAAKEFAEAVRTTERPTPELYLEYSNALSSAGPEQDPAALEVLEQGLRVLPRAVSLEMAALEVEIRRKKFAEALVRLARLRDASPQKSEWEERRGDLLGLAGRAAEQAAAYRAALAAIERLPAARRMAPALQARERRLRSRLASPAAR